MEPLADAVAAAAAESGFSGVVRVDRDGETAFAAAYGLARRDVGLANTVDVRFGIASGGKGLTALAVVSLIEEGRLELATPARSVLGDDLPLIGPDVTVEHLLAHRSGIGDYLDEGSGQDINDYVLPVPAQQLEGPEDFLPVLDGYPPVFPAGDRFAYNNGGYAVLALIAERTAGVGYHELVAQRVCEPAGMHETSFVRSDELPDRTALGYLAADGLRTNVFHLPVRGNGDGGIYSTAADLHALWEALLAGRIVSPAWVAEMVRPHSDDTGEGMRYGLGFWLHQERDVLILVGFDAGVSFRSVHDPGRRLTHTVLANTSAGAWPITRLLDQLLMA